MDVIDEALRRRHERGCSQREMAPGCGLAAAAGNQ